MEIMHSIDAIFFKYTSPAVICLFHLITHQSQYRRCGWRPGCWVVGFHHEWPPEGHLHRWPRHSQTRGSGLQEKRKGKPMTLRINENSKTKSKMWKQVLSLTSVVPACGGFKILKCPAYCIGIVSAPCRVPGDQEVPQRLLGCLCHWNKLLSIATIQRLSLIVKSNKAELQNVFFIELNSNVSINKTI